MSSQSSFGGPSTPLDAPSTPQPQDLDLPSTRDMQRPTSPAASALVAGVSSSMTPPPSSQVLDMRRPESPVRSMTPDATILSSPPATGPVDTKKEINATSHFESSSQEQVVPPSNEELQEIVQNLLTENAKLDVIAREARMSAAHYKLQHNLLTIESEEAVKRMEVEHDMTRREVQVLQNQGRELSNYDFLPKLKIYCKSLEEDHAVIHKRLQKAKRVIQQKDEQLADVREENQRLLTRIRENREHINVLRSPGGPLHMGTPKTAPTTPQHYRSTPKHTPSTARSIRQAPGGSRPFEALLLADAVLSQENNSTPSTPRVHRGPDPRTPNKHHRGAQSMSSLPTTPKSTKTPNASTLLPSAHFTPEAEARVANTLGWHAIQRSRERRRKSRDSTISAEDAEEIVRATAARSYREETSEIQESQASQSATEMLRADPRESFEIAASRTSTPVSGDKIILQQAKIFGPVTKSAVEKRKRAEDEYKVDHSHSSKRMKIPTSEAIGLGIGIDAIRGNY